MVIFAMLRTLADELRRVYRGFAAWFVFRKRDRNGSPSEAKAPDFIGAFTARLKSYPCYKAVGLGLCYPTLSRKARKDGAPSVRAELTTRRATASFPPRSRRKSHFAIRQPKIKRKNHPTPCREFPPPGAYYSINLHLGPPVAAHPAAFAFFDPGQRRPLTLNPKPSP